MARIDATLDADIRFYCGSTGSGKTHQIKQDIKAENRIIKFDPDDEYTGTAFYQIADLLAAVKKNPKTLNYRFVGGGKKHFLAVCKIAFAMTSPRHPVCLVVDELAGVTGTSKAEDDWHTCLTRGRKYGLRIRAGAQMPVEIDKTIMRQRSHLWIGYLERPADHDYLAKETGLKPEQIKALRPRPHFDHIAGIRGQGYKIKKGKAAYKPIT